MEQQRGRKTYKYKLKVTPEQERLLDRTLMLCRHVYNAARGEAARGERREAWQKCGVSVTYYHQKAELPDIKAAAPEYGAVNSQVLKDVAQRVDRAFQAFFRRVQAGETPGYPRFQGRDRYTSLTSPQVGNGAQLDNGFVVLATIGRIAARWSRPLEGTPKTVTISREADGWYVCCSCADAPMQPLPPTGRVTGIDLRIEAFATLSEGTRIFSPGWYRTAERALKTAQRRVSRRKKGSRRRRKAVNLLATAQQKVRRQRTDFHHKTALALVQTNAVISHEDLQIRTMVKNHHLAKSIQRCSGCGVMVQKGFSVRWHACPDCGTSLHRDQNAAKNRERLGQSRRGDVALAASEH
jgi:putative transposase